MNNILSDDQKYVWHPFTPLIGANPPIPIERARGVYLYPKEGERIIDAVSSWWVNIHGHSNEYIATAIAKQALDMEHVIFAGFTHAPAVTLAKRLLAILPGQQQKIFYSDNGSTAVEVAIKMALQFWHNQGKPKKRIIALEGSYHGDTFGGMSVAERGPFNAAFQAHLFNVDFIPFPTEDNFATVLSQFIKLVSTGEVAGFIFEPLLQGTAGMRVYNKDHLDILIKTAHASEVVCIADEVMTGFGRTGKNFACDYLTSSPDILCLSKGITGGFLPLGVTPCNSRILSAFETDDNLKTFFHGHSYTANPISCAAANASLDLLLSSTCQADILRITTSHNQFLESLDNKNLKDKRAIGTVLALELKTANETSYFNPLRKNIYNYFLSRNILLRPLGNVIYILPPCIITNEELQIVYKEIEFFLRKL